MIIKPGASIAGLKIEMRDVLIQADRIYKKYNQELTITAGTDGVHSPGSLHYYGYALDLRNRFFTDSEKASVADELQTSLGSDYDVIKHSSHIHVEYDKAKFGSSI